MTVPSPHNDDSSNEQVIVDETMPNAAVIMAPMTDNYNHVNQSQSTVWRCAKPLFAMALQDLSTNNNDAAHKVFRVADWGCATGGNSLAPLAFVSQHVPCNCALEILLGDLPGNAWNLMNGARKPATFTSPLCRKACGDF